MGTTSNHIKSYKYYSKCEEAFLINTKNCPRCGSALRSKPRRIKSNIIECLS